MRSTKAQYTFNASRVLNQNEFVEELETLKEVFKTKSFRIYIADKCIELVREICNENTYWQEHSVWTNKLQEYKNGHKVDIGNDYVLIFNDTNYSQDELWWLSPKTRDNYIDGLSVAYLIEYGMGINGSEAEDWQVNMPSAYKRQSGDTWVGYNPDNYPEATFYHSQEGKFIYLKLQMGVEERFEDWVNEYIGKVLE